MNLDPISPDHQRLENFISALSGLLSHKPANSRLTRSFAECEKDQHKTDCIVQVLQASLIDPEVFFSKVTTVLRLHSEVLTKESELLTSLNNELRILGLKYDPLQFRLAGLESFEPYIQFEKYVTLKEESLPNLFYTNLIREINWCYATRAFSATKVMIRKLFENLLIDILRKKYSRKNQAYYFSNEKFLPFRELIRNFKTQSTHFQQYSKAINNKLFKFLHSIRCSGNWGAHSIEDRVTKDDLDKLKGDIEYFAKLLISIFQKIP